MATDPKVDADRALALIIDGLAGSAIGRATSPSHAGRRGERKLHLCGVGRRQGRQLATIGSSSGVSGDADGDAQGAIDRRHPGGAGERPGRDLFGFQSSSPIEDRAELVGAFRAGRRHHPDDLRHSRICRLRLLRDLRLRPDDFGHDVLAEMNRFRVVCDLSHVGPLTDRRLHRCQHARGVLTRQPAGAARPLHNKSDDETAAIAEPGAWSASTPFPGFCVTAGFDRG